MIDTDNLQYLPKAKYLRPRPVMVIGDCPLALEMKNKAPYSSQSAGMLFSELSSVGINRLQVHASYLFNFRPEKADLGALFFAPGLPTSEYIRWRAGSKELILRFAFNDLKTLRDEIQEVNPGLIICLGRWALYFLSGETTLADTRKTPLGTLLKWRASHLTLSEFWEYQTPHVLLPLIPPANSWKLPDYSLILKQDFVRAGRLGLSAIKQEVVKHTEAARGYKLHIENSFAETRAFLAGELVRLDESATPIPYAVDVETRQGYHDCVSIAVSEIESFCIPWATLESPLYWSESEEVELGYLLRTFLQHPKCFQIGQNYWYDLQYFWRNLGIKAKASADTMIQHHVLFSCLEKNLAFLSSLYTKFYRYWKEEGAFHRGKSNREHWLYNDKDTCYTFEVYNALKRIYATAPQTLQKAYKIQLLETLPALVDIMNRGVRADVAEKERLSMELGVLCSDLKEDINYIVGEEFNPNSPLQMKALFYDLFLMPKQYSHNTGKLTTDAKALQFFAEKNILLKPLVNTLNEYAKFNKIRTTIVDSGLDIDLRLRTSYSICGTTTYRLNSSKNAFGSGMNHQNVPSAGKTASGRPTPNCRTLFIPDPKHTFFDIDLDSADLRIVVAISGATELRQMLDAGLKPYVELMKEYYHDPKLTKYSPRYKTFKAVTHASNYIGSARGIAIQVGLLVHEVEKLQKRYFLMNPEIVSWHKDLRRQVMKRGWIENIFGYRRYFFNKEDPTIMQIAAAWRPQSEVGLIINKGLVNINNAYKKQELPVEVLLQVHDSLGGQYPTEEPWCLQEIKRLCEIELPYEKPFIIPVDIKTSTKSWGDCELLS